MTTTEITVTKHKLGFWSARGMVPVRTGSPYRSVFLRHHRSLKVWARDADKAEAKWRRLATKIQKWDDEHAAKQAEREGQRTVEF